MNLKDKLRSDSYALGVITGIVVPIVLFVILMGGLMLLVHAKPDMTLRNPNLYKVLIPKFILIAMLPSVFIMRHYLLNLKYDKTGRGILISTFLLSIVFVIVQFTL